MGHTPGSSAGQPWRGYSFRWWAEDTRSSIVACEGIGSTRARPDGRRSLSRERRGIPARHRERFSPIVANTHDEAPTPLESGPHHVYSNRRLGPEPSKSGEEG